MPATAAIILTFTVPPRIQTYQCEDGIKKNYEKWKGPKKIYDMNTTEAGPLNHNLIGIFNPNLDDIFIQEINKWINSSK